MIIETNTKITISSRNFNYYKSLGFDVKNKDVIDIPINFLSKGSHIKILCMCDNEKCKNEKYVPYKDYIKITNDLIKNYFCSKCKNFSAKQTNTLRYGVEHPTQLESIKEKTILTCFNKYGVSNPSKLDSTKEKVKITNNEKFGVDYPLQSYEIFEKLKKTNLEKFGVEHASQSDIVKDKMKQTNLEKFGVEYANQSDIIKDKKKESNLSKYGVEYTLQLDNIKEKGKATNFNKLGVEYASQSDIIKDKIIQTNLKKFGIEHIFQAEIIKEKSKLTRNDNIYLKYKNIIDINEYSLISYNNSIFTLKHKKCNIVFNITIQSYHNRNYTQSCLCTNCYPISEHKSIKEKELINWIKCENISYIEGDRNILGGKELDVYLNNNNIALEFNGLYWHSELHKNEKYHLNKSLMCQEQNINLIHIWEDEWLFKQEIVKSIIKNYLDISDFKIFSNECEIKEIRNDKIIRNFLENNNFQRYKKSFIKIGLYYNNEIVSIMTFGYNNLKNKKFKLINFCNILNTNVIDSYSTLFNYFLNKYEPNQITSISDFTFSNIKIYENLGFKNNNLSKPDYFWYKKLDRIHSSLINKKGLIKEGFSRNKTINEIMIEKGYNKIWSCGQIQWEYTS